MENELYNNLQELGLTDGEIKTYLALVELGSTTVGPIIERSRITSSKVYIILDKLIYKGLVNYSIRKKTKYFYAAPPNTLMELLEDKEKKLLNTKSKLNKTIITISQQLSQIPIAEDARIYRGYEGMKTAWTDACKTILNNEFYYFLSMGYGEDPYIQRFFMKLSKELKSRNIKICGIANVKEKELYQKYYKKLGYQMKYTKIAWPSDLTIAGNNLLIFVWDKKEPIVYSIRSRVLVESYRIFIENMWKNN